MVINIIKLAVITIIILVSKLKLKCIHCNYKWVGRKKNPKSCPRCKRRFDYPLIIEEENKMKKTEEYLNKEKLFRNIRGDRK